MVQRLTHNLLEVSNSEFRRAMRVFKRKRLALGPALFALDNGFLTIESGDVTTAMHAAGEWHGRATCAPNILRALAAVPPTHDPVPISYADDHLLIGSLTIPCQWRLVSEKFIGDINYPGLLDLLALERTISRPEYLGSELGKRIRSARNSVETRIAKAALHLADLEISESEIQALVEARILTRLQEAPNQA